MKRKCRFVKPLVQGGLSFVIISVLLCGMSISCANDQPASEEKTDSVKTVYYCPMHPNVQQSTPGTCPEPECNGMPLVLKGDASLLDAVLQPTSSNVLSKVNIVNPVYKSMPAHVDAFGFLDYDNYGKFDISSRYSGRIEKLYVKYNYQQVKKGDKLFEIYSPDLVTAQENLLYVLKNSAGDSALVHAARQKLILLQLTADQIQQIEISGKVNYTLPIYSKYDGQIREMLNSPMTSQMTGNFQQTPLIGVREGMYVERGQVLFNVANPHMVVAMLQVKSADIGKVRVNQSVKFYLNGDTTTQMEGSVNYIDPLIGTDSKTFTVRVNVDNTLHTHKVGSLVNAKIHSDSLETLWLPATAVVDLGVTKIVWLWKDGYFKATKVDIGLRSGSMIEIADGITEADQVAGEAHFLSDSEDFIKPHEDE